MPKSKNEIKYLKGVADVYGHLGLKEKYDIGFMINDLKDIVPYLPYYSDVYRADYYYFLFIKDGKGNYTMDDETFEYDSGTVYFTNPGHIKSHTFFELKEAYRIAVTEEFLKAYIHPNIFNEFSFLLAEIVPPQSLSAMVFKEFENLYLQIFEEFSKNSPSRLGIIGKYLAIILFKIKDKFWNNYYPIEEGKRGSQIVNTFKNDLEKHFVDLAQGRIEKLYSVSDFAALQHLNTNYFNQVIKSKTGRSVSSWISEKTLSQAKALLKKSPRSIKEIAYLLGYSETSHFSNFFKKHMGISPLFYRKRK